MKTLSLRLPDQIAEAVRRRSEQGKRSINSQIVLELSIPPSIVEIAREPSPAPETKTAEKVLELDITDVPKPGPNDHPTDYAAQVDRWVAAAPNEPSRKVREATRPDLLKEFRRQYAARSKQRNWQTG